MSAGREPPDAPAPDERELVAELRALYRRLAPPPLAEGPDEVDPETARVLGWARGAWRSLEPACADVPSSVLEGRRAPLRSLARLRRSSARSAAAAAVLLLLAGALWLALASRGEAPDRDHVARTPQGEPAPAIEFLLVRPDQIELRSGPVRLVLLGPPAPVPDDS